LWKKVPIGERRRLAKPWLARHFAVRRPAWGIAPHAAKSTAG
jgi:hypothetical protein